jgi:hypothetical protein
MMDTDSLQYAGTMIYPLFHATQATIMFTPEQVNHIDAKLVQKRGRTHTLQLDGTPVIVKQQKAPRTQWWYPILNAMALLLRQPMLHAVPAPGGSAAQAIEIARLHALSAAGIAVPQVLHVTEKWFAQSSLGTRSIDQLLRQDPDNGRQYWEDGLEAILQLHRQGHAASQCFSRNMIWCEGRVGFIDFEDVPGATMPLKSAQTRDWLLYLHSTAYILKFAACEEIASRFLHYLQKEDEIVQYEVWRAACSFGWMRILPTKRRPWGRDVISLEAAASVLHHVRQHAVREEVPCRENKDTLAIHH